MLRYNQKEIGVRVQLLRKSSCMTQEQLARKLNISTSNLSKIERGVQGTSLDLLIDIAVFFGRSLDYVVLGRKLSTDDIRVELHEAIKNLSKLEELL